MIVSPQVYCLDANVLIEAWQKYYAPSLCPEYWDVLNHYGKIGRIFIPEMVYDEIVRTQDELTDWLKKSSISRQKITSDVGLILKKIYEADASHSSLVDATKGRSLADPWVIAHAIHKKACVVTKEEKVTASNSKKVKIPNVCENMGVRCINDFQLLHELKVKFSCTV